MQQTLSVSFETFATTLTVRLQAASGHSVRGLVISEPCISELFGSEISL